MSHGSRAGGGGDDEAEGETEIDAEADGEDDGDDDIDGDAVGEPVGEALVGDGPTPPVQVTPLRVKLAGTGLDPLFHEPLKPKLTLPPVEMVEFHPALVTVTCAPDWV